MIPFLRSVAEAYLDRGIDMSRLCMMFPNKRSGRFFLKFLHESLREGQTVVAPEVVTITDFVQMLSGRVIDSRIDLILLLYRCYCSIRGFEPGVGDSDDFERFRMWGETMLQDFDEVDLYGVDADAVFGNVRDYREISSNFLTPEQRRVMAEYFGRTDAPVHPESFWKSFGDGDDASLSPLKRRFLSLWETMSPLYHSLREELDKRGLATVGGAYRLAAERLREEGRRILPWDHIGVVGFNALSTTEFALFSELKSLKAPDGSPMADFFWDGTGPVLSGADNSATRFLSINRREFPSPEWACEWLARSDSRELPEFLKVVASPSNSAQAKIVGETVAEIAASSGGMERAFSDARVAVVLPDENLLLPLLYSLPPDIGDVNLTMGYSLRLTSTMSFVYLLRQCHSRQRKVGGVAAVYHTDLRMLLAHPFSHLLFGSEAIAAVNSFIDRYHRHALTPADLSEWSEDMARVLTPLSEEATPEETAGYLDGVLLEVKRRLDKSGPLVKSRLDSTHIDTYRDALRRLSDTITQHKVPVNFRTLLHLADRLLGGEKVNFEGEPLSGLQIMGTLETRSLDFDTLIIPSMNERIMPMRARRRTFIPDTLRAGYGMPPSNYAESLFAYYFYRLISRARKVVMTFDSRTGAGGGSGDVSRYVLQLRHLFAPGKLMEEERRFSITGVEDSDPSVGKDGEVLSLLAEFSRRGSGRNLSASSLRTYFDCQARFFYECVLGLDSDPEPDEYMNAPTLGTVLHNVLMEIYLPDPAMREKLLASPLPVTPEYIEKWLGADKEILAMLSRNINIHHFHCDPGDRKAVEAPLSGETAMVAEEMVNLVKGVLRHDLALAPFSLLGCEIKETFVANVGDRQVNVKMAIDRLDLIREDGVEVLRVVDYKTGSVHLEAETVDEVFTSAMSAHNMFQLLFYAWALRKSRVKVAGGMNRPIRAQIYDVRHPGEICLPVVGGEPQPDDALISESFAEGLEARISEIFNPGKRFEAAEQRSGQCGRCPFSMLCGR